MTWRNISAHYTTDELGFMRELRESGATTDELETIHAFKGLLGAKFGGARQARDHASRQTQPRRP